MAQLYYGVWNGEVLDNRGRQDDTEASSFDLERFGDFDPGNPIRAFFGDRGFLVFDPKVRLIDAFWHYMKEAAEQSCGRCTPCRVGTVLVRDALDRLRHGQAAESDFDDIQMLSRQMAETSLCGLGQTCSRALLGALDNFRDRMDAELVTGVLAEQNSMTYMTAPCIEACPSRVNVPRYIDYIRDGQPEHSLGVILQKYPMAATCGRVCVRFCEMACRRNLVDQAVGIKTLKRYVADYQKDDRGLRFTRDLIARPLPPEMRVAVVGAGPTGISCAYHLLLRGYNVDIMEAIGTAGGMAAIGIPAYRLPKDVLKSETDIITALGGRILYKQALGREFSVDDLFERGYKAVYLALGCQQGTRMGVKDEDPTLAGYESGIGFLLKVHDHLAGIRLTRLSGEVVVVGGGNVAMDCVRSALRMGAEKVHLVYRRTREDMPADHEEIKAAEEEGVIFHFLTNPSRILSENGRITGIEVVEMRSTEPDASGRRGVAAICGTEQRMNCSTVIAAIGQQVQSGSLQESDGVKMNRWNCVEVDKSTLMTSRPGVFAGGDCCSGPSTLIHAMANGLQAARSIDDWIQLGRVRFSPRSRMRRILNEHKMFSSDCVDIPVRLEYRVHHPELDPEVRKNMFEEVEGVISQEEAYREARRCMRCYRIYQVITEHPIPEGAA
jgi:formate dehydrogenase beta subunit